MSEHDDLPRGREPLDGAGLWRRPDATAGGDNPPAWQPYGRAGSIGPRASSLPPSEDPPDPLPEPPVPPTPPLPPVPTPVDPSGVGPPHMSEVGPGEEPSEPGHEGHEHRHERGGEPLGDPLSVLPVDPNDPTAGLPVPVDPSGVGPPHMSAEGPGGGSQPPLPAAKPVDPSGVGPPHMSSHSHERGHGHHREPAPIDPTGVGPPHASAGEEESGSDPSRPSSPGGSGGFAAPSGSSGGETPQPEPPSPPEPPIPPVPPTPEPIPEAGAEPGEAGAPFTPAPPPPLPPWLRGHDAANTPPGSPGRIEAVHPSPPPAGAPAGAADSTPPAFAPAPPAAPPPPAAATTAGAPRLYGSAMATGVLLTLAGGSAAAGGIFGLWQADAFGFPVKALICGGIAVVLLVGAVLLRLLRGSDELRGVLAVVGIAYAAASLTFAYDPSAATDHDNLVKLALGAGLVAVLGWFTAIVVPSAVAGFLGAVALPTAAGAGVWLGLDGPTHVEVYVAALGIGLALALVLPRLSLLHPHPTGLLWALGGTALVVAMPAVELTTRGDAAALAAGATASAGMLLLAHRHRHLPSALASLAGFAALEGVLVSNFISPSDSGGLSTTRLIVVAVAGAVLVVLVAAGVLLDARGRGLPRWPLPVAAAELLLAASLVLAVIALFTGPGDVPFNPPQLSTTSTATLNPAAPPGG